jgi:DNA-binding MarR family transcriptional regulator
MGTAVAWNEQRISRQLKLRDLHVLMTVARCGSMGKAADQLSVSQPAISKATAGMETALGGQAAASQSARRRADDLCARAAGPRPRRLRRIEARHRARQFPGCLVGADDRLYSAIIQ